MNHAILIPYYCEDEVGRYLRTCNHLRCLGLPAERIEFILVSAPSIEPSQPLYDAFSGLASTTTYRCITPRTFHPGRATAMFWEAMNHVNANYLDDGGFVLWLESDMVPIRQNWIERLEGEWSEATGTLVMGMLVPGHEQRGRYVPEHINGGACYSVDLIDFVDLEKCSQLFDVELFPFVRTTGRYRHSRQFRFAGRTHLADRFRDPDVTIIHAVAPDKDGVITDAVDNSEQAL